MLEKKKSRADNSTVKKSQVEEDEDETTLTNDVEEQFFNTESYYDIIEKYELHHLDPRKYYVNEIHKEELIVKPEDRKTSEIMTQAEYTRVLSERAKQIENGSPIFVNRLNASYPEQIALMEIQQKKCPLSIVRYTHNNTFIKEIWDVNEMLIPFK